jgi:hypothetical protein
MAEKKSDKKVTKKKEEVHEIYEIMKNGKEKIVETKGIIVHEEIDKEGRIKKENKTLRNILIGIGVVFLIIVLIVFIGAAKAHFNYKGVKFNIVKEGQLVLYHTSFPVVYQGKNYNYNIYLRNDPRELDKTIPASGTLTKIQDAVINITQEFDCNGTQMIAIANLQNTFNAIGKAFMRDENASCDPQGRYMYLVVQPGNETSIKQFGPGCYNINIKDCEILPGTERFIAGMLVKINVDLTKNSTK